MKEQGFESFANQWILFIDKNGRGFAQPDFYFLTPETTFLVELKLTQSDSAEDQCRKLYVPLLEKIYSRPCVACQVYKNARYEVGNSVRSLKELLTKTEGYFLWHNLGELV